MRKFVLAVVAATAVMMTAVIPAAEAQTRKPGGYSVYSWHSVSMTRSGNGWGYGTGYNEEGAREDGYYECEAVNPGMCAYGVSVERSWWLSGIYCFNSSIGSHSYTAGSRFNQRQADENAYQKAADAGYRFPYNECYVTVQYAPF